MDRRLISKPLAVIHPEHRLKPYHLFGFPPILIFHLERVIQDGHFEAKNETPVFFPESGLDLGESCERLLTFIPLLLTSYL